MFEILEAPHARHTVKGPVLTRALKEYGAFVLNNNFEGSIAAITLHGLLPGFKRRSNP